MGELLEIFTDNLGWIILALVIIWLICITWKKAAQDKAIVVTGLKRRVISGKGGFVVPFFEQTNRLSLENMKVEVKTHESLDSNGVPIDTDGVAIIKVKSDPASVLLAMEQFNTGKERETIEVMKGTVQDVLEGKLREIVSKMSIEEIYKDREMFANEVENVAKSDLERMGLEIKTFTIRDIDDTKGYLQALGAKQIAEAEAKREEMQKTAEAKRLGMEAQIFAEAEIARANKEKELKVQSFKEEEKKAQAKADFAYEVEKNIVHKKVVETLKDAELFEEQRQTDIAEQQVRKKEKELESTVKKVAEADKYRAEQAAEAERFMMIKRAEAEAETIKIKGMAEADAIRLVGEANADAMKAEAEAMKKKAEAYKEYGEAAIIQMLTDKLPEVAKNIAEPLSRTEKMVIIDNGGQGGAAKVSKNIANIMAEVPEVINSLTGIDLVELVKGITLNKKNEDLEDDEEKTIIKPETIESEVEESSVIE